MNEFKHSHKVSNSDPGKYLGLQRGGISEGLQQLLQLLIDHQTHWHEHRFPGQKSQCPTRYKVVSANYSIIPAKARNGLPFCSAKKPPPSPGIILFSLLKSHLKVYLKV